MALHLGSVLIFQNQAYPCSLGAVWPIREDLRAGGLFLLPGSWTSWIPQARALGTGQVCGDSKSGFPRSKAPQAQKAPCPHLCPHVNTLRCPSLPRTPLGNFRRHTDRTPPMALPSPKRCCPGGSPTPEAAGWTLDSCSASSEGPGPLPVGGHKVRTVGLEERAEDTDGHVDKGEMQGRNKAR